MNRVIIARWVIGTVAALSLISATACGGDSEPSAETQPADTTSSVSPPPPPPPAATSAPPPAPAPTQALATVKVGHRVGDQAPDYTLALTGDRQITSADLVAEGKPVFILFHATW
jgi:hypothetical protein